MFITFWYHVFVCWQWNLMQWLLFSSYKLMLETYFTYWKLICHDLSFLPTSYSLNYKVPALLQFLMPQFLSVEMLDWRTVASTPAYLSSENDCHLVPYSVKYRKNLKSFRAGRSEQTVPTQIRLLLKGAVWSGSTLFAIPSASFWGITVW